MFLVYRTNLRTTIVDTTVSVTSFRCNERYFVGSTLQENLKDSKRKQTVRITTIRKEIEDHKERRRAS